MFTITVNIYKYNQFKWQEQVLLNASTKAEAKQKAIYRPYEIRFLSQFGKTQEKWI